MKIETDKWLYDMHDEPFDEVRDAVLMTADAEVDPTAVSYHLSLIRWDDLMAARARHEGDDPRATPCYLGLNPVAAEMAFWPTPDRDYFVRIRVATTRVI